VHTNLPTTELLPPPSCAKPDIVRRFLAWVQSANEDARAQGVSALARAYLYSDLPASVRAEAVLATTNIRRHSRIGELSKGMITQLHLTLILAINARLLVLDEPTLGLDLIYRRQFYDTLLSDYFDQERTILLTTHQVEEVENLLTDVLFIDRGRVVLDATVDALAGRFVQLNVAADKIDAARELQPFHVRTLFGKTIMLFENRPAESFAGLGEVRTPGIADLFEAKIQAATP